MSQEIEHTPAASRLLMLIGTVQGALLCWLWQAAEYTVWPATSPMWLGALLWLAFAVPGAWYLSAQSGMGRRQWGGLMLAVVIIYGLLGVYAGWVSDPLETVASSRGWGRVANGPGQVLGALVALFVLVPLVAGWRQGRWDYHHLFELAWRNGMLLASVFAVTLLFWAVLMAGAMLMDSIGLDFLKRLIREPVFIFPVTGIVVGSVFAQGLARVGLLGGLRRYWLGLNSWLLPLLLVFGVFWVLALPMTGLDTLFATGSAAFFLLWFAVLAVNFINCAWQEGTQAPPYPRWLALAISVAWLSLPVVVTVAGVALSMRIHQYGWTEDRIWALFVWLLITVYALGYSLSWFRRGGWMRSIGPTNITVAVVGLITLGLLLSPVMDPRRLAVADQVARLLDGRVSTESFDFYYLRHRSDRWGLMALAALSAQQGNARLTDIATRARQTLAASSGASSDVLSAEDVRRQITVLHGPGGASILPDDLVAHLQEKGDSWETVYCLSPQRQCAIWLVDLNDDGADEAVVLVRYAANAIPESWLLARDDTGWRRVGSFGRHMGYDRWRQHIGAGELVPAAPVWPDLLTGEQRLPLVNQDTP